MTIRTRALLLLATLALFGSAVAQADVFSGTLYYTKFTGGANLFSIDYSYNSVGNVLTYSNNTPIPHGISLGADGVIFDSAGHLLVGGQAPNVQRLNTNGTGFSAVAVPGLGAYHLTLSPDGSTVYTSDFGGPLASVDLSPVMTAYANKTVSGGDVGVTQIAFAPDGTVFYVDGSPNGFGNVGTGVIGATTFVTTRNYTSLTSAHGIIYDSFTGLMTLFGAGAVGTIDPGAISTSLKQRTGINADFDQGSLDGFGHAFIAGNGQITFIDYSATSDITAASGNFVSASSEGGLFAGIDDLAPLSGAGSNTVPEPGSIVLLATVCAGVAFKLKRRIA